MYCWILLAQRWLTWRLQRQIPIWFTTWKYKNLYKMIDNKTIPKTVTQILIGQLHNNKSSLCLFWLENTDHMIKEDTPIIWHVDKQKTSLPLTLITFDLSWSLASLSNKLIIYIQNFKTKNYELHLVWHNTSCQFFIWKMPTT